MSKQNEKILTTTEARQGTDRGAAGDTPTVLAISLVSAVFVLAALSVIFIL